jgi:hypothetical protein
MNRLGWFLGAGALVLSSCAVHSPACVTDARIMGTWRTAVRDTQMGRGFYEIEFSCDCTFKARMTLIDAKMKLSSQGTFTAKDGVLEMKAPEKTTTMGYELRAGKLIEHERPENGSDEFEYTRIKSRSCRG